MKCHYRQNGTNPTKTTLKYHTYTRLLRLGIYSSFASTVGSHLSELQLSEHVGYPNAFSKATPTISGYFCRCEAVQMADIECFRLALPVI